VVGTCLTDAGPSVEQVVSGRLYAIRVTHACKHALLRFQWETGKAGGVPPYTMYIVTLRSPKLADLCNPIV